MYEVRSLLDNTKYAVKKIVLNVCNKNKENILKEIDRLLQEIRFMAKIKSEYVVSYNHSWIEVELKVRLNLIKKKKQLVNFDKDTSSLDISYEITEQSNNINFILY